MSTQRLVDSCFWDDSYIVTLDPCEKLLFLYLLTNPLTNIAGVYEVSMKRIAFDTGFERDTVQRILARFERDGRCVYRDGWIAMRNWLKHQRVNPSVEKGIERALASVPKQLAGYVKGQSVTDCIQDALPNLTQLNSTQPTDMCVANSKEPKDSGYPPTFDAFWKTYPRRIDKKRAYRCWLATQKRGAHLVQLQNAAMNYAKACTAAKTEERFIKHPSTFLGPDESWRDYLGSPHVATKRPGIPPLDIRKCPNGHDYLVGTTCRVCGWKEGDDAR